MQAHLQASVSQRCLRRRKKEKYQPFVRVACCQGAVVIVEEARGSMFVSFCRLFVGFERDKGGTECVVILIQT